MNKIDISVDNVSMIFRLTQKKSRTKRKILKMLKEDVSYSDFYALKSVSFDIKRGERIGIIGHNGAGKSTLLNIICGIMKPTEGNVSVNGSIAPLLALGAGFEQDFSGVENIYLNGAILGKTKKYLDNKFEEIVEYSELGKFIHNPVKNYSSGMKAKLGFSIVTQVDADILIIDEILGVGDQKFRSKSSKKMIEMIMSGKTVVLVSHSLDQIRSLTDKVIWLHNGEIKEIGQTQDVCDLYESYMDNN